MNRVLVLLASAVITGTACGGGGGGGGTDANEINLHGVVTQRFASSCDDVDPAVLTNKSLEFRDVGQQPIGNATTGDTSLSDDEEGCLATAPYEATLPKVTYYQARVPGQQTVNQMSYQQLEAANFEWNFD
jgi:hypothetical protein